MRVFCDDLAQYLVSTNPTRRLFGPPAMTACEIDVSSRGIDMDQKPTCPLCETDLKRCAGALDMPASQEYWQCSWCGLSTHMSWLMSPEGRRKIRDHHVAELNRRVEDGREALDQLKAARKPWCGTSTSSLGSVGLGVLVGAVVGFLLSRR